MKNKLTLILGSTTLAFTSAVLSTPAFSQNMGDFVRSTHPSEETSPSEEISAPAVLDPNYQPTAYTTGVGDAEGRSPSLIRLRTTWQGDGDRDAQCNSLLDSFRNRAE